MLTTEKKCLEFLEKHMYVFLLLLLSALAFYIRRAMIWWNTGDVWAYFDYHENTVQSCLYYLLMGWLQYLPMLPVHSIKYLSIAGDFGTAFFVLLLVREKGKENTLRQVFSYILCLFSPVLFLRGAAWAQIDSVAVCLFLAGLLLLGKGRQAPAAALMLLSALLYPCMVVFSLWYLGKYRSKEKKGGALSVTCGFLAGWLLLCGVAGVLMHKSFGIGLKNSVAWLFFDPVTGLPFSGFTLWLQEIVIAFGLPGSIIGGLSLVGRRKPSWFAVMLIHFAVILLYGSRMF